MKKKAIPCHKAGRITSFFLLISIFLLIPSITTPVYAVETYTQQTVFTLHATNKTVKEVFEYIEKNSEFVVLYSEVTKIVYFIGNEHMLIAHDSNRLRFS